MIIPDNEIILFKSSNELSKRPFFKQGFIISLVPMSLISAAYIFFRSISPLIYFTIVLVAYIILSIMTSNSTYNHYSQFFGHDEFAMSKDKIYYNICMNIQGRYTNYDTVRNLCDITDITIRSGWNPQSLVIYFKDGDHITIHSLRDINKVKEEVEKSVKA